METRSRRTFLAVCLGGIGAAAACLTTYPLIRYLAPRQGEAARKKVAIPSAEVPEGGAKFFEFDGSTAVLIRKKGGDIVALSAVCTHLGCIVQWQKENEQFLCPCHGGLYTADGAVVSGPPPKPLEKIPFVLNGGSILVG
ncbi:MAG TPA: ubiquinol-cytochrome c reductase iron-sulfur subunit [Geobacteraceae bacterium]|nr:ubiquinol-cytochrome c reductase iron-sulfur subunit [Geobacteraceae bacterium]